MANERSIEHDLRTLLSQPIADQTVIVDPRPGATLQQIMDAFALSRKCGAKHVALRCQDD